MVTLTEFGIESSLTEFRVGQPYRFVVTNAGALNHELTIMSAGASEEISQMHGGHDMHQMHANMPGVLLHLGEDQLPPGATATAELTFTQLALDGELEFVCHLVGHYEAGMFIPITVDS